MTIPTRPAPAPPGSRPQAAAASANASLEQLRLQLQQQHQQQQQLGGIQKLTIKLPPPPKGHINYNTNNNINNNSSNSHHISSSSSSSITRTFPKARYSPATNWDDSPFDTATLNGNLKKVPPPRPPPPKVPVSARKPSGARVPPRQTEKIFSNIFHRKKATTITSSAAKAAAANNVATRVYGVSSGNSNGSTASSHITRSTSSYGYTVNSTVANWGNSWHCNNSYSTTSLSSLTTNTSSTNASHNQATEGQLISFDSPPSSPTFTQKSNSDCVSVDSFSSDSNFSSPNNGSVSQPESGFEDDFSAARSRPATTSPLDPWESLDAFGSGDNSSGYSSAATIGTAPIRNVSTIGTRTPASHDNPLCNGKSLLPLAPPLSGPTIIKPKISQKPKAPKPPVFIKQFPNVSSCASVYDENFPPSPPMPQQPPPPPPTGYSLLDVISGKVDAIHLGATADASLEETSPPYGVALYDFDGAEEDDLSFRENEKIYLLEQVTDEWYRGRTRSGCEGIFPANFIDIKVPLPTANTAAVTTTHLQSNGFTIKQTYVNSSSSSGISNGGAVSYAKRPPTVRCLYNFPAEVEGDLELRENDLVTILYRINEDWLYGEIDGRQGQFPLNFLEYVPDNIPLP